MINLKTVIQVAISVLLGTLIGALVCDGYRCNHRMKGNDKKLLNYDVLKVAREMEIDANVASQVLDIAYSLQSNDAETVISRIEGIAFVKTVVPPLLIDSALHEIDPSLVPILSHNLDRWWRYAIEYNPSGFSVTNDSNVKLYRQLHESLYAVCSAQIEQGAINME